MYSVVGLPRNVYKMLQITLSTKMAHLESLALYGSCFEPHLESQEMDVDKDASKVHQCNRALKHDMSFTECMGFVCLATFVNSYLHKILVL